MKKTWLVVWLMAGMMAFGGDEAAENLLQNGGFEAGGFDGWTYFGQGWRVSDFAGESSRDMHDGKFGLLNEIAPTDADEWRGAQQVVKIKPNKAYELGAWVRVAQVGRSQSYLELQFLDKQSNIIEQVQSVAVDSDQEFRVVNIPHAEVPKDACWASVRAVVRMLDKPAQDIGYHMVDDFVLTEVKKPAKNGR